MDKVVLGYDSAGFITHVTRGTAECCKITARQIKNHYKMIKVVDDDTADRLIELDLIKWIRANKNMKEALNGPETN